MRRHSGKGEFSAPWGFTLRLVTGLSVVILVALSLVLASVFSRSVPWLVVFLPVALLSQPAICALFCVRSYSVHHNELRIRRMCWTTRRSLKGLKLATVDPQAMKGSLRLFGNGGLFVFAGWFRNRRLGRFRAWVTDPVRCVVLEFPDRKWVVSPDRPQDFVAALGFAPAPEGHS